MDDSEILNICNEVMLKAFLKQKNPITKKPEN